MGFAQGFSGLRAAAADLDSIGNNIANAKTNGYKSSSVQFADVYASARTGLGTSVAGVTQNFATGPIQRTDRDLDLAIDGGGFLRLSDAGTIVYSRDGHLVQTKDGFLANSSGALVTGYNVGNINSAAAGVSANGNPEVIRIPDGSLNARASTQASMAAALDAGVPPISTPFDANDASTYHWASPVTAFDSLGNAHSVTLYFTKTAANAWEVNGEIALGPDAPNPTAALTPFALNFDGSGNLTTDPATTTYTVAAADLGNGADDLVFDFDFAGTTQTAQSFTASNPRQDGYASGSLTGISIEQDGTVVGSYDNGQIIPLAQIALASFRNENGLKPVSGNAWVQTAESGQPALGTPGTGLFGALNGGALEGSNIDLAQELVNLIVSQRNYQANAQTIKTQDQILQTLVTMR